MFKNSVHKTNTCWSVAILAQDKPIGGSFAPVGQIAFVECMSQALVIAAADVDFYHTGVFLDYLPQSILVATLVVGVILLLLWIIILGRRHDASPTQVVLATPLVLHEGFAHGPYARRT
jgi:hypothetical protein